MALPLLAGTVILARQRAEPEVLLLKRQPHLKFMGGYWVFPGGAADAAELQGVDLEAGAPAAAGPHDEASPRSEANASQRAARIAAAARAACRELREEADLTVDPATLRHWAHWITPSGVWRRFDTHFFLAPAPSGQRPRLDEREASEWCWVPPHLHACDVDINPEFPLTAPTQMVLREIAEDVARLGSLEALLASAPARSIRTVIPKMIGMEFVVFPWDPDYHALSGESSDWPPELIASRSAWPGRLPATIAHPMSGAPARR